MILKDALKLISGQQKIKIGAVDGVGFFYIGKASDFTSLMEKVGGEIMLRDVLDARFADPVADPGAVIIIVTGEEFGRWWCTSESEESDLSFR